MPSVMLGILKIIGLVLLVILILILLAIVLLLFVPFRYRLQGGYEEKPGGQAEVSWLMRLVRVKAAYRDGLTAEAKLLCFKVWSMGQEKPPEEAGAEMQGTYAEPEETGEISEGPADTGGSSVTPAQGEDLKPEAGTEEAAPEAESSAWEEDRPEGTEAGPEYTPEPEQVSGKPRPPKGTPLSLDEKLKPLADKVFAVKDEIDWWAALAHSKEMERFLKLLFHQVMRILKNLRPRKLDGEVRFGFEDDPFKTGQMCSYAAVLYPILEDRVRITPYFDRDELFADVSAAGRLHLFVPAWAALRIWFNKDFKTIFRKVKKKLKKPEPEGET